MADIARSPPLSKLIEDAYGFSGGYRLVRGLYNWRRYLDILSGQAPEYAQEYARQQIKTSQYKSGQVLLDWWSSAYHIRSFMEASRKAFAESARKILEGMHAISLEINGNPIVIHRESKPSKLIQIMPGDLGWFHQDPKDTQNLYHRELFGLWIHEFMIYDEDVNDECLFHLLRIRRRGLAAAVCQRLAHSVFEIMIISCIRNEAPDFTDEPAIRYWSNDVKNISPSIDPCSWLGFEEKDLGDVRRCKDPPHFLWDRVLRHTIETSSCNQCPGYWVISYMGPVAA
jgi:hypothetical protein